MNDEIYKKKKKKEKEKKNPTARSEPLMSPLKIQRL